MVAINPHTTRATGTVLTAAIYNADHQNHITNAQNLNGAVTTNAADIIVLDSRVDAHDAELLALHGKPTVQMFTAAGAAVWNRPVGCKSIFVEGVGAGGAGGGVDGQGAGFAGAGSGGGSGAWGRTAMVDVTAIASGNIVIGAAGVPGAAGNANGGNGGDTTIILGATTYTWKGGQGGFGVTASNASLSLAGGAGANGASTNLQTFGSDISGCGIAGAGVPEALGGCGGSSPYGQGGTYVFVITSAASNGAAPSSASARGAGGSGAAVVALANNQSGGAGSDGLIRVWEFY